MSDFTPFCQRYNPLVECYSYGLYAIASLIDDNGFPLNTDVDKRQVNVDYTAKRFEAAHKDEGITTTLSRISNDKTFHEWKEIRNLLSHRASPHRKHFKGGDRDGETALITPNKESLLNANFTNDYYQWLVKAMRDLLRATDSFSIKYFTKTSTQQKREAFRASLLTF